jgi:pyrroline-5-carboxylate reductase
MKITIIGAGNMGGAIARGFAAKKVFAAKDITCCDRSDATLEGLKKDFPGIGISKENAKAVKGADIVLFAVKPWILPSAVDEVKDALDYKKQLIISIAAGVGLDKLAELFDKKGEKPQMVYLIPNIAVEVVLWNVVVENHFISTTSTERVAPFRNVIGNVYDDGVHGLKQLLHVLAFGWIHRRFHPILESL